MREDYRTESVELRFGRWQDRLADVLECDSVITDPPYSARTHKGQRSQKTSDWMGDPKESAIPYEPLAREDVDALVRLWTPRTKRWFVMFGDDVTTLWAREALESQGWFSFQPIPWTKTDASPRICGDGPSPQTEWIAIGRSRTRMRAPVLRFRRGFYSGTMNRGGPFVGTKPEWLMRALVRDYSEPGDLIVDPYSGSGTTLRSALIEGRRAIGAESDGERFDYARKRLAGGFTPLLFDSQPDNDQFDAEESA